MIHIIAGEKGKGKTKILIDKANESINSAKGNIVYLDKSNKHMHELSNKIRLINVRDYLIKSQDEFIGFILGIVSQDHDIEFIFFDSFLYTAGIENLELEEKQEKLEKIIKKIENISEKFDLNFIISISMDYEDYPESIKKYVNVSL